MKTTTDTIIRYDLVRTRSHGRQSRVETFDDERQALDAFERLARRRRGVYLHAFRWHLTSMLDDWTGEPLWAPEARAFATWDRERQQWRERSA